MKDLLITTKEIDNHRIKIYYDTDAFCPCTDWDLAACYLFEYNESYRQLHNECNWKEIFADNKHNLDDALVRLANDYVETKNIIQYFKKDSKEHRLTYNKNSKMWEFQYKNHNKEWEVLYEFDSPFLHNGGWNYEMLQSLDTKELIELIDTYGKDIFIKEWDTVGYCQGDRVEGIAYCTKERYVKMVNENASDWKNKLDSIIDSEVKNIGMWMWGDVKGFKLEKKVGFTKVYEDGREPEKDYDWEEIETVWGYFMETEELINTVIQEHQLKETAA